MVSAGFDCPDCVLDDFRSMNLRGTARFLVMRIIESEGCISVVDRGLPCKEQTQTQALEQLRACLQSSGSEPAYVVLHWSYCNADGDKRGKTLFMQWMPSSCGVRNKLIYAATSGMLKNRLDGVSGKSLNLSRLEELTAETFDEHVSR